MRHEAHPVDGQDGFYPGVEDINIIEDYVLFSDGHKAKVDSYLDFDECYVDDGADADTCWVEHPAYGWLQITINPEPVTMN